VSKSRIPLPEEAAAGPPSVSERPAAHRERGPDEQADAALVAALDEAPPDGLSADELAARCGRSRAWVFTPLHVYASSGQAVKLRRGRWTGARGRRQ